MLNFLKSYILKWFLNKLQPKSRTHLVPLVSKDTQDALLTLKYFTPEPRASHLKEIILNDTSSIEGIKADPELAYLYAKNILNDRWKEAEHSVLMEPECIYHYAADVIKGRWAEGELAIQNSATYAAEYAITVLQGRWSEIEDKLAIAKNEYNVPDHTIIRYARLAIKGRFHQAEPTLLEDPTMALNYCIEVMNERWPELEKSILENQHSCLAASYAVEIMKSRWIEAEEIIKMDASAALQYAARVMACRWIDAEESIKHDPLQAAHYADLVIKGRWLEAEPVILNDCYATAYYVVEVIKGRWEQAEPVLAQMGSTAIDYAVNILCDRFPEGEAAIETDDDLSAEYKEFLESISPA